MQIKVIDSSIGIKDVDVKQGIVVGYFAHFNSKDAAGDIIIPGAFKKTISENLPRIKHLLDHDRTKAVGKILSLEEDNIGLKYESKAGRDTKGRDFLLMCEDGIITEHSFGYDTIDQEQKSDGNYLTQLKMWEGSSLQAWGCNENTPLVGLKEYKHSELIERMKTIEDGIRNGKYSDDAFIRLEKELKAINHLLSLLTLDTTKPEPIKEETTLPGLKYDVAVEAIKHYLNNNK